MFTGIVTDVGTVKRVTPRDGAWLFEIQTKLPTATMALGASVACAGVCLTVIDKTADSFMVEVSNETLDKTRLRDWAVGTRMNLEAALKLGDELGGHMVTGHVDGLAKLESVTQDGGSYRLVVAAPEALAPMIAAKGSVALDGVSLTVNSVDGMRFGVNIIPHTWDVTTLGQVQAGQDLHIEVDPLARYVARLLDYKKA